MDFSKLKDLTRKVADKARQAMEGLTELEVKVEEATNDDKWGPHGALMAEITKEAYREEEYKEILAVVARRLASEPKLWRRVYKSLLLLEYMAKNGPERMVSELKSNHSVFARLQSFEYIDDLGKDQGLNVRNRAKELWNLVNDADHIAHERERADANRNKYAGYDAKSVNSSSGSMGMRTSGGTSKSISASEKPRVSDGEDPVVATRKRLEALKASEEEKETSGGLPDGGTGAVQKKKLSDIKVDSSIAAALAKNFKPPAAPAAPAAAAPAAPAAGAAAAAGGDLLAFDEPAPAPKQAPAPAGGDDWAAFESAPPPKPAAAPVAAADPFAAVAKGGDDWSNFSGPALTHDDPLAGLTVAAPPPSAMDPFASMAASGTGAVPESFSPGSRSELPADMFSQPVVAPVPAFAQPSLSFGASPAMGAHPPAGGFGMPSPAAAPAFAQPPLGAYGMPPPGQYPGTLPATAVPGLMPAAGVAQPVRPVATHMGGPTMGTAVTMQIPAPLKKDPFADLF